MTIESEAKRLRLGQKLADARRGRFDVVLAWDRITCSAKIPRIGGVFIKPFAPLDVTARLKSN